ncbi:uncharacterized protein LOC115626085 [Scaptodrosophila lebanonensis]|uniref:Uncharacterized protein LOC115626085 n=1 Tax=Drosophila lebanonensis TaxID=7225 RepID=A0A6J2TQ12_DROLE|nr:uncharacterized protein LOC115626085 [Scaptodrosophila lebanonensis]
MAFVSSAFIFLTWCAVCFAADQELELPPVEFKPVKSLPADIPTCSENDLNINDCIKQAFQKLTPRMKYGISELNIPPMDPFELGKSSYNYNSGLLQGRIAMRNVVVHGLSDGIVDKVDFRLRNGSVRLDVVSHVPHMYVEGNYKADIKLNNLNLTPKGSFNVTLTDVRMRARPTGELYERDGHTYLRLTKIETEPRVGDMRINASGLVPDPALNDVILDFINQYWRQLYQAMLPETLAAWQPLMLKSANDFFGALPFDLILTNSVEDIGKMHCTMEKCWLLALMATLAIAAPANKYFTAKDVPKCAEDDDLVGECIKNIINAMTPRLKDGNPELKQLPYEPFVLNRTTFQYSNGPVNGRITVRNAKIHGFANNKVKDVDLKVDGDKIKVRLVSFLPKINIVGSYKADMQVNSLHLKPKGDFNLTLSDVETTTVTEGEIYKKDGLRFLRLTDIDTNPKIRDLTIKANGIFADPELDEIANTVANQYWRDIYGIMLPETRQYWQPLMLRMLNDALEYVPIDQFIKESD